MLAVCDVKAPFNAQDALHPKKRPVAFREEAMLSYTETDRRVSPPPS